MTGASPLVSVVVPLYNKGPYVRRALASILAQTWEQWEAIVVDDGSTDDGPVLAESFVGGRVRMIRQENQGPGAARNRGLAEASGELVAFLDADDEWTPVYLEQAVEGLRSDPGAASWTCGYTEEPGGISTEPMWRQRRIAGGSPAIGAQTNPMQLAYWLAYMSPCTTVARTSAVRKWGGFYANGCRYGEDAYLWLKVLLRERVLFSLAPYVRVHRDAASLSGNVRRQRQLEPFLEHPVEIREVCPTLLRRLLEEFLTLRAFKTSSVWGYWGYWREARALRARYRLAGDWKLPYYWTSLIGSTPAGPALGALWRALR